MSPNRGAFMEFKEEILVKKKSAVFSQAKPKTSMLPGQNSATKSKSQHLDTKLI